jgi:hypothetical protein
VRQLKGVVFARGAKEALQSLSTDTRVTVETHLENLAVWAVHFPERIAQKFEAEEDGRFLTAVAGRHISFSVHGPVLFVHRMPPEGTY